ncbi:hypothetical protein LC048_14565 [Mesobacillus subterraneus]|uniref:hypothetical protein n=1 Tax=Mesobacillus subterraneus TaxID=285983 RepID=UPI001CFEA5FD|nr:hypothetical protein [Mesobacillus subterraneus]WLR53738.1 hypothetical protein LC048_14565 [Mesobacillus subterraneus]
MKKSFEIKDSFRSLSQIPRSEIQKRKTYNSILQTGRPNQSISYIARNWSGRLLTLVMILVCSAYLLTEIKSQSPEGLAAINPAELLAPSEIVITYLTKSIPSEPFNLHSNLTRKGVSIIDDQGWLEIMNRTVNGRNPVKNAGEMENTFDLLLIYEGRKPDKCKLWVNDGNVYIKRVKEQRIYKVEASNTAKVIAMIEDMEKQVQF